MKRDERKRRFNEAIVSMLYPSPSQPQHEQESEPVEASIEGSGSDVISGTLDLEDYQNASTSGNEEHDSETEKLTRAQRKKIRKKKLKEEATRRGKIIGPLLAATTQGTDQVAEDAPAVRSNASEEAQLGLDCESSACAKSMKMKHRRMAKRMAKEKRNVPTSENSNQSSTSAVAPKEACK